MSCGCYLFFPSLLLSPRARKGRRHGLERFDLTQDGSDPVGCDRVEKDFDCETWSSGEDVGGHDITIVASLDTEGSFLDETVVMGQHSLSIACQGGDCWLAELFCDISFPCAAVFSFTAEQDEALGE